MDRIIGAFRAHPATVGETYLEHLRAALGFAGALFGAALACGVHAFLPFLFQKTGSTAIEDLHRRMVRQRATLRRPAHPREDASSSPRNSRAAA